MSANVEVLLPQIAWHDESKAIQSVDTSPSGLIATAGSDNNVVLWRLNASGHIVFVQSLSGHTQAVNVVRFCPLGTTLASAGDDNQVMLWRAKPGAGGGPPTWGPVAVLRGHTSDVHDLVWSPRADSLFSGCNDGTTIVWSLAKFKEQKRMADHEGYVHGVAWDPQDKHIVSVSCDRTARVYSAAAGADFALDTVIQKRTHQMTAFRPSTAEAATAAAAAPTKADAAAAASPARGATAAAAPPPTTAGVSRTMRVPLFLDEVEYAFYRRPHWSPDGSFLLLPCGQYFAPDQAPPAGTPRPTTYVFHRDNLERPCAHLPSPDNKAVVAVRCSPVLYEPWAAGGTGGAAAAAASSSSPAPSAAADKKRVAGADAEPSAPDASWMGGLPHRVVFAVATLDSVAVYDSSSPTPLMVTSHVHYASLTDLAWMRDGSALIASSMDGYCTVLRFRAGALGTPLARDKLPACMQPKVPATAANGSGTAAGGGGGSGAAAGGAVGAPIVQMLAVRKKEKKAVAPPPPSGGGSGGDAAAAGGAASSAAAGAGTTDTAASADATSAAAPPADGEAAGGAEPAKKKKRIAPIAVMPL